MADKDFYFVGAAPLSKSLLSRALIVKSWFPEFQIKGDSSCQDIQILTKALEVGPKTTVYHCGLSGTALRFLALRLSRKPGEFTLTGDNALLSRPFHELPILLNQLCIQVKQVENGWHILSKGWVPQGDCVYVPSGITSQYASALLLNSWMLNADLYFNLGPSPVSFAYFKMTLDFVRQLGMQVKGNDSEYWIPKNQKIKVFSFKPEQDKSCLFALAALAALKGQCLFKPWKKSSLQPDGVFPEILNTLGVSVKEEKDTLKVRSGSPLKPITFNLRSHPDLFPVLAVLCAKAEGRSCLSDIRHQAFKESHRLNKIKELLELSGIKTKEERDSLFIFGRKEPPFVNPFVFDCSKDHRIVMAAALMKKSGTPLQLIGSETVNKSFPDFFNYIGGM